ncbi:MAG: GAF domain-containing protein, partial [Sphingobacteriales bacterium]
MRERDEAREQQTATADVLKVISRSAFNLQTVLDTLVESAARLCNADSASIHQSQGEAYPCIASYGLSPEFQQYLRDHPIARGRGSVLGRVVSEGKTIHVPDVLADAEHTLVEQRRLGGYRTVLGVPLRREGEAIGLIRLTRNKVQPFTDKQIELVTTFADQAVIAIENVRLFDEVQKRTRELSESLDQQTATSEVLKVISSSPGELEPVFNAILANATRICEAKFANLFLYADNSFRIAAQQNAPPAYAERWRQRPILAVGDNPRNPLDRLATTKCVVNITDLMAEPGYVERNPRFVALVESAGARSHLAVPMLKDGELVGAISIYRQEV